MKKILLLVLLALIGGLAPSKAQTREEWPGIIGKDCVVWVSVSKPRVLDQEALRLRTYSAFLYPYIGYQRLDFVGSLASHPTLWTRGRDKFVRQILSNNDTIGNKWITIYGVRLHPGTYERGLTEKPNFQESLPYIPLKFASTVSTMRKYAGF